MWILLILWINPPATNFLCTLKTTYHFTFWRLSGMIDSKESSGETQALLVEKLLFKRESLVPV
jgi:hypothetical protein